MIIITARVIYYFQFKHTLEHCQESGEERGERLAPGDQGDPQRGKEGKYVHDVIPYFKTSMKGGLIELS